MTKKNCKKEPRTCETELDCKATAALKDEVMKELGATDRPLKEFLKQRKEKNK